MKKLFTLLVLASFVFVVTGCGSSSADEAATPPPANAPKADPKGTGTKTTPGGAQTAQTSQ